MELSFRIAREPSDAPSLAEESELRRYMVEAVTRAFLENSRLASACRGFGDGFVDVVLLDGLVRVGEEAFLAAVFRGLSDRPGVARRFREGELVYEADGELRRAIGVVEHLDDDSWWLSWAPAPAGEPLGAWVESTGFGVWTLPPAFRAWLDQGHVIAGPMTTEPAVEAEAEVRMYPLHLSPGVRVPLAATILAEWLGRRFDHIVARGEASGVQVISIRGAEIARWEIVGQLPLSLDDLVRGIGARTAAEALAVMSVVSTEIDGVPCRAVALLVERDGRRAERLAPIEAAASASDEAPRRTGDRSWVRDLGEVGAPAGWLGVAPGEDPGLFVIGVEGLGEPGDA